MVGSRGPSITTSPPKTERLRPADTQLLKAELPEVGALCLSQNKEPAALYPRSLRQTGSSADRNRGTKMLRTVAAIGVLAAVCAIVAGGSPAAPEKEAKAFPDVIQLPPGFRPEGIEVGRGTTFYVGSVGSGALRYGNLRTEETFPLVAGGLGRPATGIEFDRHNRLFVAGAGMGNGYVYDARSGDLLKTYNFAIPVTPTTTFINDVVVTHDAAYFTDSRKAVLYRVPLGPDGALGDAETINLGGDYVHVDGQLNLNGIDATRNGKVLVAVQTAGGKLYRIDPATGTATMITLADNESVPNGDGILLTGRMLYVVQNQLNRVAVIRLNPPLTSGRVLTRLTDSDLGVPTTIDDLGRRLYTVNAHFGIANPDAAAYEVVQLRKPHGH
jgi:sugar lactone lactonase YvrE